MRRRMTGCLDRATLCILIALCSGTRAQDRLAGLDAGTVKDSTYSNTYFGMKLRVPDGWQVQDNQAAKALMEQGKNLMVGDDKSLDAMVSASEKQSLTLLTMFKYQPGSPVDFNPGFICLVERVSHLPGIKKGSDYLFHLRKALSAAKMRVEFDKDFYDESVGGLAFGVLETRMTLGDRTVRQKYYSTIRKGYALSFVISYTTDDELKTQNEILKSVTFQ